MYLHLGQGTVVPFGAVTGIFDLDNTTQSYITRDYLRRAEQAGQIVNISEDIPKSFVVCVDGGRRTVYLSQLATATLLKRGESMVFE
jgi:hypothetical protein